MGFAWAAARRVPPAQAGRAAGGGGAGEERPTAHSGVCVAHDVLLGAVELGSARSPAPTLGARCGLSNRPRVDSPGRAPRLRGAETTPRTDREGERFMARIGIDLARRIGTVDRAHLRQLHRAPRPLHLRRHLRRGLAAQRRARLPHATCSRRRGPLRMPCCAGPAATSSAAITGSTASGPKDQRPRRTELAWHAEESNRFGTDEFIEYCRVLEDRAVHLRQHGHGHDGRGPGLGRVLQWHGQHLLGEPAPPARPRRAVPRPVLGPRQRDVRRLADRQPERPRLRQEGARLRQGHEADRPVDRARRLRPERLERLGRDRARRARRARSTSTASTSTRAAPTTTPTSSSRTRPSARSASARR